jgi:hypothetical protein
MDLACSSPLVEAVGDLDLRLKRAERLTRWFILRQLKISQWLVGVYKRQAEGVRQMGYSLTPIASIFGC